MVLRRSNTSLFCNLPGASCHTGTLVNIHSLNCARRIAHCLSTGKLKILDSGDIYGFNGGIVTYAMDLLMEWQFQVRVFLSWCNVV